MIERIWRHYFPPNSLKTSARLEEVTKQKITTWYGRYEVRMINTIGQQNKLYGSVLLRCTSASLTADVSNERIAFIFRSQTVHEGGIFFRNVEQQLPYMSLFFWVLTVNIWVSNCRRFEWTHRLLFQGSNSPWRRYFLPKRRASITVYEPVLLGPYFKYLG